MNLCFKSKATEIFNEVDEKRFIFTMSHLESNTRRKLSKYDKWY